MILEVKMTNLGFQKYIRSIYANFSILLKEVKKSRDNVYEMAGWVNKDGIKKEE